MMIGMVETSLCEGLPQASTDNLWRIVLRFAHGKHCTPRRSDLFIHALAKKCFSTANSLLICNCWLTNGRNTPAAWSKFPLQLFVQNKRCVVRRGETDARKGLNESANQDKRAVFLIRHYSIWERFVDQKKQCSAQCHSDSTETAICTENSQLNNQQS